MKFNRFFLLLLLLPSLFFACDECLEDCVQKILCLASKYCYLKTNSLENIYAKITEAVPEHCHLGKDNMHNMIVDVTIPIFKELHYIAKNNTLPQFTKKSTSQRVSISVICDVMYSPYCCQK